MSNTFRISLLTATVLFSASALSALPQGYPAEYQKVVDAATLYLPVKVCAVVPKTGIRY